MKKTIAAILAATLLSACGSGGGNDTKPEVITVTSTAGIFQETEVTSDRITYICQDSQGEVRFDTQWSIYVSPGDELVETVTTTDGKVTRHILSKPEDVTTEGHGGNVTVVLKKYRP
jgi:ABC-type glycerol-3-phosphate transport system substrate-binding protein